MPIEKIGLVVQRDTIQSNFDNQGMTALEVAAAASAKVDECVDKVNGVEQSAIEATAVVDEMRIAQEQFITENNDIRQQLVTDNEEFIDTLEASKTTFETTMTTDLNTFKTNLNTSKATFETDMDTALEAFETSLNTSKTTFETNMNTAVTTIVNNSNATIETNVNDKIDLLVTDGTLENLINVNILNDVKTDVEDASKFAYDMSGIGVVTGLQVLAQTSPNMTVLVATGTAHAYNGQRYNIDNNANMVIDPADASYPRIDIIYVNSSGVLSYGKGIANASPVPLSPANAVVLAEIYIAASAPNVNTGMITDKRVFIKTNPQIKTDIESINLQLLDRIYYNVRNKTRAEIQTIINTYAGKRIIYFGNTDTNIYSFDDTLKLPSTAHVVIAKGVTITLANNTNKPLLTNSDTINGNTNITVEGGIFDGNGANQTLYAPLMRLDKVTGSHFENMELKNNRFVGLYYGIGALHLQDCNDNNIVNCSVHNVGDEGLYIVNSSRNRTIGGKYYGNTNGSGVATSGTGAHNEFINVWADNCEGSNFSINTTYSKVINCLSTNGTGNNGITLGHTGMPASHSLVDGCIVQDCEEGIRILGGSKYVKVTNCLVEDLTNIGSIGIGSSDLSEHSIIVTNTVRNCGYGIYAAKSGNIIENNRVEFCTNDGITISQGDFNVVNGNKTENNTNFGINIDTSNNNIVTNNQCSDTQVTHTQKRGIYNAGNNSIFTGNMCINNTVAAMSLGGTGHVNANNITA